MTTIYSNTVSVDFGGSFNVSQFQLELQADVTLAPLLLGVTLSGDDVKTYFSAALDPAQTITFNGLVSAHIAQPAVFTGEVSVTITAADSPYQYTYGVVYCDTTAGDITINLPKASNSIGLNAMMQKTNIANSVIVDGYQTELIDGSLTSVITTNGASLVLNCDGTAWTTSTGDNTSAYAVTRITTAAGDFIVDDGTIQKALPVGADGQVVIADSASTLGVGWAVLDHAGLANAGANSHAVLDAHVAANTAHGTASAIVGESDTQTLTNKTIAATANTITALANANVDAAAALDATKIANGTVANAEFQSLNGVTGALQTQLDNKAAAVHVHSAADVTTGLLAVARGGTGLAMITQDAIIVGAGTAAPTAVKFNWAAAAPPTVSDDSSAGYSVGSRWMSTGTNQEFVLVDSTAGAAIWSETTASGGTGDVVGPVSISDNAMVRFDTTSGKLVQAAGIIVADTNALTFQQPTNALTLNVADQLTAAGTLNVPDLGGATHTITAYRVSLQTTTTATPAVVATIPTSVNTTAMIKIEATSYNTGAGKSFTVTLTVHRAAAAPTILTEDRVLGGGDTTDLTAAVVGNDVALSIVGHATLSTNWRVTWRVV